MRIHEYTENGTTYTVGQTVFHAEEGYKGVIHHITVESAESTSSGVEEATYWVTWDGAGEPDPQGSYMLRVFEEEFEWVLSDGLMVTAEGKFTARDKAHAEQIATSVLETWYSENNISARVERLTDPDGADALLGIAISGNEPENMIPLRIIES
ncbi:hypothetical protein [Streptomyces sp. NPDC002644]